MTDELMLALDDCLRAIEVGETLPQALARHPAQTEALRPLLEAALLVGEPPEEAPVPRRAEMSSRARFLTRAAELRSPGRPSPWRKLFASRALASGLALFLVLLVGTYGAVSASAQSLPGDALYSVKRAVERTELLLSPGPQARDRLEQEFAARRVQEAQTVTAQGRSVPVEFGGRVQSLAAAQWVVEGFRVAVGPQTQISGAPFVGAFVDVFGDSQADGTVLAAQIIVEDIAATATPAASTAAPPAATPTPSASPTPPPTETPTRTPEATAAEGQEIEFIGVVEAIEAGVWRIAGLSVNVTAATEIQGSPRIGQTVEVRAVRDASGALTARRIRARETARASNTPSAPGPTKTPPAPGTTPAGATPGPTHTPGSGGGGGASGPTHTPGSGGSSPSSTNTPQPGDGTPEPTHTPAGGGTATETPHPEEVRITGTLESISGSVWTVAGQAVTVTGSTEIKDNPQVGDQVEAHALRQLDGSLVATRITRK